MEGTRRGGAHLAIKVRLRLARQAGKRRPVFLRSQRQVLQTMAAWPYKRGKLAAIRTVETRCSQHHPISINTEGPLRVHSL